MTGSFSNSMISRNDSMIVFKLPTGQDFIIKTFYSQAQANGVTVLTVASFISLIAVLGLLTALGLSAYNTRFSNNKALFVRTHVAWYFVSLLICELMGSIGSIMSIRWIREMQVVFGHFCTAQGIIKELADIGTAIWALILAIHTFCTLFLEFKPSRVIHWLTFVAGWSFIGLLSMIGPATVNRSISGPFHGIAGLWCWIAPAYQLQRTIMDYMWMWISASVSLALYLLVFLRLRGTLIVSGFHVKFSGSDRRKPLSFGTRDFEDRQNSIIARQMLLYPIAYTLLIVPISAARLSSFYGHQDVSLDVTIFCDVIYLLSGFVNVVLFSTTRRVLPARSVLTLIISKPSVQDNEVDDDLYDSYYDKSDLEGGDVVITQSLQKGSGVNQNINIVLEESVVGGKDAEKSAAITGHFTPATATIFATTPRTTGLGTAPMRPHRPAQLSLRDITQVQPVPAITPTFVDHHYQQQHQSRHGVVGSTDGHEDELEDEQDGIPQLSANRSPRSPPGLQRSNTAYTVASYYSGESAGHDYHGHDNGDQHLGADLNRNASGRSQMSVLNMYAEPGQLASPPPLPTAPLKFKSKNEKSKEEEKMDDVDLS